MDVLNFTNTGSELTYVAKIGGPAAYGYRGGSGSFFYQHGRMTSGPDISITYNEIGMPTTVLKTTTENIYFVYDAEGRKWRQERSWSPTAPEPYDTNNNVEEKQFSNGLESINDDYLVLHHAEGRSIIENNAVERIEYYMKDHLGNIRLVFSDLDGDGKIDQSENTEEVLETYAYYPFGLEMEGVDEIRQAPAYQSLGYNGKERIGDNLYDYGFRIYMAGIGRWNAVDPLAEKMPSWSPYVYGGNNPISNIDVGGLFPWPVTVRSFISAKNVGLGMFRGDGRGASFSGTSRVISSFTVDPSAGTLTNRSVSSDPTVFYGTPPFALPPIPGSTKVPEPSMSAEITNSTESLLSMSFSHEAKDPITPAVVTPDLDLNATLSFEEDLKNGILSISGSFTGDNFPSAEAFISDQSGSKLFLGASKETGGVHSLFGENNHSKFNVNFQVQFNSNGNFTGVRQGDNTFSVKEWNQHIQNSFNK